MTAPLLRTTVLSGLLASLEIYTDKLIYREPFKRIVINRDQIASISSSSLFSSVIVETTGGRRYVLLVSVWQQTKVLALLENYERR